MPIIQWFPGHMAKALRLIREQMSSVDIVFELVDARLPYSSQNPEVAAAAGNKPRLLILTKADLADQSTTAQWLNYFENHGQPALALDSRSRNIKKQITKRSKQLLAKQLASLQTKGRRQSAIRAMCVGVPNVGKSTLLNHLVGKNVASTGNRPGITTGQQWLRSSADLELLDTPGVLWPKFASQRQATMLAATGAIKEGIYPVDDVALFILDDLRRNHQQALADRYHLKPVEMAAEISSPDLLMNITAKMGFRDDYERGSERLLQELRKGKFGRVSLETPAELEEMD